MISVSMKAALISPYSPRKVTGVGTSIIDLCREFVHEDTDFFLAVPQIQEDLPLDSVFSLNENYFEAPNPDVPFLKNLRVIMFNNRLLRKNRGDIDLVHIFSIKSSTAAAAIFSKILNKPVISTIYIFPPEPPGTAKKFIHHLAIKIVLKLTSRFSYETALARRQCGHRPGMIIPEGIDVDHFKPDRKARARIREKWKIDDDKFVLLYSGRLVESKGIIELLDAVSSLPDSMLEKFVLMIIGNIETGGVDTAVKKLKGKDWFLHAPPVDRDEVKNYYCAADAFVLPSYYEGISSSLIEAMACELPPIVTRAGGNIEVVTHERNGLVVEVKDVPGLRAGIESMVSEHKERKRMARAARKTVVNGFSVRSKVSRHIKLYMEAISANAEPGG
jgi:teichuronic acid biosynthesis glycosyltransferase TuaC